MSKSAYVKTKPLTCLARLVALTLASVFIGASCYSYETRKFEITIPETAESSVVVSSNGTLITTLVAPQNRTSARRLDEIPGLVRQAVIAIEDERFYQHDGVDLKAIVRAARTNLEQGGISQGGSTISNTSNWRSSKTRRRLLPGNSKNFGTPSDSRMSTARILSYCST